jgi:hypothetical protein
MRQAIENVKPLLAVTPVRKGASVYQVIFLENTSNYRLYTNDNFALSCVIDSLSRLV